MKNNSRTKNLLLNIIVGYVAQVLLLLLSLIGRKIFLYYLDPTYLGVNGLYSNILTILSLAELGLDTAATFSLYKPIAENNNDLVASLVRFFRRIYLILSSVIIAVGLLIIPLLKFTVNSNLPFTDIVVFYVLFLINTVCSYFVAYKVVLINAMQRQRVRKFFLLGSNILLQIIHIVVLAIWKNYYAYLISTVCTTIITDIIFSIYCSRRYSIYLKPKELIKFDKKPILERLKSVFLYKIGGVLINSTDNILISTIVSTYAVGLYSNYLTITSSVQVFIAVITSSLIAGVGSLAAGKNVNKQKELFFSSTLFFHFLGGLGFVGFSLLFNEFIDIWIGSEYCLDFWTVMIIALNFYLSNAISSVWVFREANGLFTKVRYLLLIRALINVGLSILLGIFLGVLGILLATAISLLVTCFWLEPQILFKNVFITDLKHYWLKQLKYFMLVATSFGLSFLACYYLPSNLLFFIIKVVIIIIIYSGIFLLFNFKTNDFQFLLKFFMAKKTKK